MISQPKATISQFSGMSDKGGTFYIDGFAVENENGVQSLDEAYNTTELFTSATYTDLGNISAIAYIFGLSTSSINRSLAYKLVMDSGGRFFTYHPFASQIFHGKIMTISDSSQKPDILEMNSGNLVYTAANSLGLIVRGTVKTGSGTTKIIDTAGRNFETLGIAANDVVVNLKTGENYTITSITDEDATKDCLNFSAGTANNEGEEFLIFDPNFKTLASSVQFAGQPTMTYWQRPIRQYGNQYMILNGNYIALLAADESTFDATYKQLPTGYQSLTFEIGQSDNILVSAYDKKGQGYLLLWDGFSDGWNEIIEIARPPQALKAYGSGWVYMADGVIYFTDGRSIQKLISHPDTNLSNTNPENHNAITVLNDVFYFCLARNNLSRQNKGVLVFDRDFGLTFFKCKTLGRGYGIPYCIYANPNADITSTFNTTNSIEIGCGGSLNELSTTPNSTSTSDFKSIMFYLDFKQEMQIGEVWLNLKRSLRRFFGSRAGKNTTISINYGNGNAPSIKYGSMGTGTTTTINNPNGALYPGVVGEEVEIASANETGGQRTFITSIADGGTSSEVLTVSPALSAVSTGTSDLRVWGVKSGETKTITLDDLSKPIRFNTNFFGSKMWLEIVIRGTANSFPVSIENIQLF